MVEPNPNQRQLIENTEGIYLVDAGAGTGKTFTLTRRYAHILEQGNVEPRDILLITFTNNAADEMKERVINHCDYNALDLQEAPISTFHGLCNRFLLSYGFDAPTYLGLNNYASSSLQIMENYTVEQQAFREFCRAFKDRHPEYQSYLRLYSDPARLLDLIHSLTAKGIFPTASGWYQSGERYLDGNWERFRPLLDDQNQPLNEGSKQSKLRGDLNDYKKRCFHPSAPSPETIRDLGPPKQANPEPFEEAFQADRTDLKNFVHDLYFEYIDYALDEDYLNFGFLMMLSYVSLCERPDLRKRNQYRYVMVDEFQDTSEIQFKLAMLLSETNNFCAVGDWKQSIYSFQYASVDNIREFSDRLRRYREELNQGGERITYPVEDVNEISLRENYRSTQEILDRSKTALTLPGTASEDLDEMSIRNSIVDLEAILDTDYQDIDRMQSEDEIQAVLARISEIVDHENYRLNDEGTTRPVRWSDIAVLSRTRQFGLEIQEEARKHGIPVAYEGGVELFGTAPSILILAWLRVLEDVRSREGWTVILEEAGDRYDDIRARLDRLDPRNDEQDPVDPADVIPGELLEFREHIHQYEQFLPMIRQVFERYGFRSGFAERILDVLQRTFDSTYMNRGQLIQFIQNNIEAGTTFEIDDRTTENTVTVQTIHGAKGLEYPVVFVCDMNRDRFPSTGGGYPPVIQYRDPVGLRQKKMFYDEPVPYQYEDWKSYLLFTCLGGQYDEERRLLYVAMTRAKQYLYLSAGTERPGRFFQEWSENDIPLETIEQPEIEAVETAEPPRGSFEVDQPSTPARIKLSPHDLMEESVFEQAEQGTGMEFGLQVHEFAERYVSGQLEGWDGPRGDEFKTHTNHLKDFLESLKGDFRAEVSCLLPLAVGGDSVLIEGVVDLIHERPDGVQVIDYKTDASRYAEQQYRKQLSIYYHVVKEAYPDRPVDLFLFYTVDGETVPLEPLGLDDVKQSIESYLSTAGEVV